MKKTKPPQLSSLLQRLKSTAGASLVELLCATLILALVGTGLVNGVQVAQRQFVECLRCSESQELYTTVEQILTNELRYTTAVTLSNEEETRVAGLYSVTYAIKNHETALVALDEYGQEDDFGELAFGYEGEYNRILGKKAYPNGLKCGATIHYDAEKQLFTVYLTIRTDTKIYVDAVPFQVRALNDISLEF